MGANSDRQAVASAPGSTSWRPPWILAAYLTFGAALCVTLAIAGWGAYIDFEEARISVLQAHLNRLRTHATRTVFLIQDDLQREPMRGELRMLTNSEWLREHWNRFIPQDESRLYAAVVDSDGNIVLHNRRQLEGGRLGADWQRRPLPEAGEDVVETEDPRLTDGAAALDIQIPIIFDRKEIGTYHSGFNKTWFETELSERSRAARNRWTVAFAVIAAVIVLAGYSLIEIAKRLSHLQTAVVLGHVQRLADLGQLAGGIAHEIRNPLNVIRLNLHVIKKLAIHPDTDGRVSQIMDETVLEMERVDGLLRSLLEYARPDKPTREIVDLAAELRSVSEFLRPLVADRGLHLTGEFPLRSLHAEMDRGRFRQIALNLLKNAIEAVGRDGLIDFQLREAGSSVELIVRDDGPGIARRDVARIFEAFFTTKELGTGLGLTLVRRYVEEAGGTIRYEPRVPQGAEFVVTIPRSYVESTDVESSALSAAVSS